MPLTQEEILSELFLHLSRLAKCVYLGCVISALSIFLYLYMLGIHEVDVGTMLQKWEALLVLHVHKNVIIFGCIMTNFLYFGCSSSGKWPSHMIRLVALAKKPCCLRKTWIRLFWRAA